MRGGTSLIISDRQNKIIEILNDFGKPVTGKDIAKEFNTSIKTIRNDIKSINANNSNIKIQSKSGVGYYLDESNITNISCKAVDISNKLCKQNY